MPMPCCCASAGLSNSNWLAVEQDAAERRTFDAGDDLHQRRFAGAVFADQHVDRAAPQFEIGALDGDDAGIDLRHVVETSG